MMQAPILSYWGGKKFVLTVLGLVILIALAKLDAPGEAYLAVGVVVGTFSGANAVISKAAIQKEEPQGD